MITDISKIEIHLLAQIADIRVLLSDSTIPKHAWNYMICMNNLGKVSDVLFTAYHDDLLAYSFKDEKIINTFALN